MAVSLEDIVDVSSDSDSDTSPDKPLIHLFKRLIEIENKQHTVFKNSQINELLQKEFNMDVRNLHVLEIDIYLTVVKKFLKEWPEWDSFDKIVNEVRKKGQNSLDDALLEKKYSSMKSFLKKALDEAEPLAKIAVEKIKEKEKGAKGEEPKDDDPVLEISATKAQLKQLFFRYPNPKCSKSIFNIDNIVPSQIKVSNIPLRSILNMSGVTITITGPADAVLYKHETNHEFEYVLCNKRLIAKPKKDLELNQEIVYKGSSDAVINVSKIISLINKAYTPYALSEIMEIINFVLISLKFLPLKVFQESTYKRHTNKYPYVRYYFKDIENAFMEDIRKYDLQLQEMIIPVLEIYIGNFTNVMDGRNNLTEDSIMVTCRSCSISFQGASIVNEIKMHFNTQHEVPDVQCNNCEEAFTVENIAGNWWCHQCK
ncbi:uncharacterized protein LOC121736073 [Aricia agestis]|uniref:uncharacterized protein LOC121736073 n=1 Tax=Aricia agestis TaxID=91739 RepID=UPI001C202B79|nr:uncharacterized protein LOC121736073 [Aricia agestis]